jgi:hypothetical protein
MRATTMAFIFFGITVISCLVQLDTSVEGMWRIVLTELAALCGAAAAGWFLATRRIGGGGIGRSIDRMRMWRLKRRYRVLTGGRDSRDDKRWLN